MDNNNEMSVDVASNLKKNVVSLSVLGVINLILAIVIFVNTLPCVKQDGECSRGMIAVIAGFFAFFIVVIGSIVSHGINKRIKGNQSTRDYSMSKTMKSIRIDFIVSEIMILSPVIALIASIIIGNIIG